MNPNPCSGVLVTDEDSVLLIRRDNEPNKGLWGIPGGFLDRGEKPEKAATRELREETGLEVKATDIELVDSLLVEHQDHRDAIVTVYSVDRRLTSGEINPGSEVQRARFVDLDEIKNLQLETSKYMGIIEQKI